MTLFSVNGGLIPDPHQKNSVEQNNQWTLASYTLLDASCCVRVALYFYIYIVEKQ